MVLRKITIDNSVRYIPVWEKIKETDNKPKKKLLVQTLVNKTKIFHKITKNSLKMLLQVDSNILKE